MWNKRGYGLALSYYLAYQFRRLQSLLRKQFIRSSLVIIMVALQLFLGKEKLASCSSWNHPNEDATIDSEGLWHSNSLRA